VQTNSDAKRLSAMIGQSLQASGWSVRAVTSVTKFCPVCSSTEFTLSQHVRGNEWLLTAICPICGNVEQTSGVLKYEA
jgi:hypothetical protein